MPLSGGAGAKSEDDDMMIHLKDINKTYNNGAPLHVLKGISLDIEKGEFVSIMGASARASPPYSTSWAFWTIMTVANIASPAPWSRI